MIVLTFQPRFAGLVRTGAKRQTIRLERKRPIKPGDELSLREWSGRPYLSKQNVLRDGERCSSTEEFRIENHGFEDFNLTMFHLNGNMLDLLDMEKLALADGFSDLYEMYTWFCKTHGIPFKGVLIKW